MKKKRSIKTWNFRWLQILWNLTLELPEYILTSPSAREKQKVCSSLWKITFRVEIPSARSNQLPANFSSSSHTRKKKKWSYLKLWERSVVAMKTASSSWSHDDVALNSRWIWLTSVSDFNINLTCCWNQILVSWPVDLYSYLQHEARERSAIGTPRISFLFSRRFSETFFHSSTRKSSILRVLNQFLTFENSFSASSIMELLNKVTAHGFISCLQCKSIAGQLRTFHVTKWQFK